MAEESENRDIKEKKPAKQEAKEEKEKKPAQRDYVSLIRIFQTDIPGNKKVLVGLTYVKGVSWAVANAMCKILKINPDKKFVDLDKKEMAQIEEFLKNPKLPEFLVNRRKDFGTGKDAHLLTTTLDITKEFDVRRLKKIRSYRGLRHALGQPTRGQKTRSHFRVRGKKKTVVGVQKKKIVEAKKADGGRKK